MSNNRFVHSVIVFRGCDLLKFEYLCSMSNNKAQLYYDENLVVICLNLSTFAVWVTTVRKYLEPLKGCDLLKFEYLCSMSNNPALFWLPTWAVVICLNLSTFAVWVTTDTSWGARSTRCDLLKFEYLCSMSNNWRDGQDRTQYVVICLNLSTFAVWVTTHTRGWGFLR